MLEIHCITVGMFQVNTYLVRDEDTGECAVIDTGEGDELPRRLSAMTPPPDVRKILLTHAHTDHAGGLLDLQNVFDVPTYLPALERPLFDLLPEQGNWFGMAALNRTCGRVDHDIDDGDTIDVGNSTLTFISTPGHTPGMGCFYNDTDIIVGDTLFAGSIGRTDFPLSDPELMQDSLRRLMELPSHLRVHSGHGPVTTLEQELRTNPFLSFIRREKGAPERPAYPY